MTITWFFPTLAGVLIPSNRDGKNIPRNKISFYVKVLPYPHYLHTISSLQLPSQSCKVKILVAIISHVRK